jgi:hypothetical protein
MKKILLFLLFTSCLFLSNEQLIAQNSDMSEWYSTDLTFNKATFPLYCRYRVLPNNKIELELKCAGGFEFEVTSKICSQTADGGNGWIKKRVSRGSVAKLIIDETTPNCQNGFWWWIRNARSTMVKID